MFTIKNNKIFQNCLNKTSTNTYICILITLYKIKLCCMHNNQVDELATNKDTFIYKGLYLQRCLYIACSNGQQRIGLLPNYM